MVATAKSCSGGQIQEEEHMKLFLQIIYHGPCPSASSDHGWTIKTSVCSANLDTAGVGSFLAQAWENICPALSPSGLLLDLISFGRFLKATISEG